MRGGSGTTLQQNFHIKYPLRKTFLPPHNCIFFVWPINNVNNILKLGTPKEKVLPHAS